MNKTQTAALYAAAIVVIASALYAIGALDRVSDSIGFPALVSLWVVVLIVGILNIFAFSYFRSNGKKILEAKLSDTEELDK